MLSSTLLCVLMTLAADPQAPEKSNTESPASQTAPADQATAPAQPGDQATEPKPPQLPVPPTAPADPAQSAQSKEEEIELLDIERNIIEYTNAERVKYGLTAFKVDKELMESAREHARWMARNRAMVHTSRPVAENIAMGYPHSSIAVRGWMNSSGHRANILNRGHTRIGVAAYRSENGTIYWCQQFRR